MEGQNGAILGLIVIAIIAFLFLFNGTAEEHKSIPIAAVVIVAVAVFAVCWR